MTIYNELKKPEFPQLITEVNLSEKNLSQLPVWISECVNLKTLNCFSNQLTSLPDLPSILIDLSCSCNCLTSLLPLFSCTRLERIN